VLQSSFRLLIQACRCFLRRVAASRADECAAWMPGFKPASGLDMPPIGAPDVGFFIAKRVPLPSLHASGFSEAGEHFHRFSTFEFFREIRRRRRAIPTKAATDRARLTLPADIAAFVPNVDARLRRARRSPPSSLTRGIFMRHLQAARNAFRRTRTCRRA
jgi:hypothetical protein